ncbi:AMPN-like protein [Mya arenaria]|uniref:AMPN-like protein n=1 Tax=Mya arenaria TaxID=6604 RepID=A0ABY7E7U6_MYAAR|nr:AMPN-like protein [Mya arenaria]
MKGHDSVTESLEPLMEGHDSVMVSLETLMESHASVTVSFEPIIQGHDSVKVSLEPLMESHGSVSVSLTPLEGYDSVTVSLEQLIGSLIEGHDSVTVSLEPLIEGHDSVTVSLESLIEGHDSVTVSLEPLIEGHVSVTVPLEPLIKGYDSVTVSLELLKKSHDSVPIPLESLIEGHDSVIIPLKLDVDLKSTVYRIGILNGDDSDWEFVWQKYLSENDDNEKNKFLGALVKTKDARLLLRLLESSLNKTEVRLQDTVHVISAVASSYTGQILSWRFVQKNWDILVKRYGDTSFMMASLIQSTCSNFDSKFDYNDVQEFFSTRYVASGERAVQQVLEKIHSNMEWINKYRSTVVGWLNMKKH